MSDEDIRSVMVFVDELTKTRLQLVIANAEQVSWKYAADRVEQARRNLIARLKEQQ